MAGGQERNRINKSNRNGAWLSAVPHHLNDMDLSQEKFRDNLRLRYGLMLQDIPVTCDSCGKKLLIKHALSCPNDGLVLARHDDAAKEWGALGAQALVPSAITYEQKINIRTVQGHRTGVGVRQDRGESNVGANTVGEAQEGRARTVNGAALLVGQPG